jgi:hypothetical protein
MYEISYKIFILKIKGILFVEKSGWEWVWVDKTTGILYVGFIILSCGVFFY